MEPLPPELEAERAALLREIETAFDGVSREGSPSWSEAEDADALFYDAPARILQRSWDVESRWQELPNTPLWTKWTNGSFAPWGFLTPLAFRYYIPAGMTLALNRGETFELDSVLKLHMIPEKRPRASDFSRREASLERWALLDLRQRRCVYRFLVTIEKLEGWRFGGGEGIGYREPSAIESYWNLYAEGT